MITHQVEGKNKHTMILLHGTGGNERDLVPVAQMIDPDASYIGIRGNVEEDGMLRFFERYPDGSFDLKSLAKETYALYDTILELISDRSDHTITVLGYSNGSNIALNMLKEFETPFDKMFLFHPAPVRMDVPFKKQKDTTVFITSGHNDPFITQETFDKIAEDLRVQDINVETLVHEYGHQLVKVELDKARELM